MLCIIIICNSMYTLSLITLAAKRTRWKGMVIILCVCLCVCVCVFAKIWENYERWWLEFWFFLHCKNKIVKITNLLVSTVARNSRNCNLIDGYGYTFNYNPVIIISIFLSCLIDVQRSRINILIKSL